MMVLRTARVPMRTQGRVAVRTQDSVPVRHLTQHNHHSIPSDMQESTSNSPASTTKSKDHARAARLRNASNRMAYITGQIPDLPPPPMPVQNSSPPSSQSLPSSPQHSRMASQTPIPLPSPTRMYMNMLTHLLSVCVAILLAANSLGWYPRGDGHDRRPLGYMYLGTLLVALIVLNGGQRVWAAVWPMCLTVYLWLGLVEAHHTIISSSSASTTTFKDDVHTLGESSIIWIAFVSFVFEFVMARIMSNSILKSVMLMLQGPTVVLAQYFARLTLVLVFVLFFPSLALSSVVELPVWFKYGGGGVFLWACLSMFVGCRVATKFL